MNFRWDYPFFFDDQLTEEERLIRDAARAYAQDKLQARVLEAFHHEHFDREMMREMGQAGFLGATISRIWLCWHWCSCLWLNHT